MNDRQTDEKGRGATRRSPRAGLFIVNVEDRHLFTLVLTLLVLLIALLAVFAITTSNTTNGIKANSKRIERQAIRDGRQERRDVRRLHRADARFCARENLVRAEVHVAYQQQQPMPPPEAFAGQPILKVLLDQARAIQERGLQRVRRNLPILECGPNLEGRSAYPMAAKRQKTFVELYLAGLLKPVPSALDAARGPDE